MKKMEVVVEKMNFNLGTVEEVFEFEIPENNENNNGIDAGENPFIKTSVKYTGTDALSEMDEASVPAPDEEKKPSRFAQLDETAIQGLIGDSKSKSTERNTLWAVRLFREWLRERDFPVEFEINTKEELNNKLRLFYAEVRSSTGELYSKSTFIGLRAGLNRHIRSPPYERDFNLMNDREFVTANNVFSSILRKLKQEGLDKTHHHSPITPTELLKIRESFDQSKPSGLQRKVWFDLTLGFARRGLENQRHLTPSTFQVFSDEEGREYITQTHSELTKNHRGGVSDDVELNKRIYATGGRFCPVASFKCYISHLNPLNDCLYQQPKSKTPNDTVWYTSRPMGTNTLGQMMKTISEKAGLDTLYTNHCLRATAVTLLSHAGVEAREICKITGHRNDQSLKSYNRESSTTQKRVYSAILQGDSSEVAVRPSGSATSPSASVPSGPDASGFNYNQYLHSINSSLGMFSIQNSNVTVNNYFGHQ